MLPDLFNLQRHIRGIGWVPVVHRVAVGVVDIDVAPIRHAHIVHEQTPVHITRDRASSVLLFDRAQEVGQAVATRRRPVVLARNIHSIRRLNRSDAFPQLGDVARIKVIAEDINHRQFEMRSINAIRPIQNKLILRPRQAFHEGRNLLDPRIRNVFVAEDGAGKFVSSLDDGDGGIFGVGEPCVGVFVREEVGDVVLECGDDGFVGVELLHARVDGAVAFAGVEIEAEPAEENEFSSFSEAVSGTF